MKIKKFLILLSALFLVGCGVNTTDNSENDNNNQQDNQNDNDDHNDNNDNNDDDNQEENYTTRRMQDTPILHCWNWSMNNVLNNLESIKEAGFKTIQLSPMQVQKDYYSTDSISNGWWKLYQPLSFTIAKNNNENILGTKNELINVCKKAKELEIDVIVDVVSNHLAGGSKNSLHNNVSRYESDIYNNNLIHNLNKYADDNNLQSIVQGNIGDFPDLKTESTIVQNRVLSLLKEYIDCGVNGFRFDAAKHIETPDDGSYASNYWPTILNGATSYAKSKSLDEPYYYGEILYTCGVGRNFSSYTKYMSIIDSSQGSAVLSSVKNNNTSNLKSTYNTGVDPSQLVLWAESHDTFANNDGESKNISQDVIDKAYVIQTSRKDASSLYLARPNSMSSTLGSVGSRSFENEIIKKINNFHNQFIGTSENISINKDCFINVRGSQGAVIVNINNSSSNVNLSTSGLVNGTYTDIISNKKYTVSNSQVNVNFTNDVCILVNDSKENISTPTLSISTSKQIFSGSTTVNVNVSDATSITYSINNGNSQILSGNTINLSSNLPNGLINLSVTATNKYGSVNKELDLYKTTSLLNKSFIVYNIDTNYTYYAWAWGGNEADKFYSSTIEDKTIGFDIGNNNMFIIVKFVKGTTSPSWDDKINQTIDISLTEQLYNYEDLTIKN